MTKTHSMFLSLAAVLCMTASVSSQIRSVQAVGKPSPAPSQGESRAPEKTGEVDLPKLLELLQQTSKDIESIRVPVRNVKRILVQLDERPEGVDEKDLVRVHKKLRKNLLDEMRKLRSQAVHIGTRVRIEALPMKRALLSKIRRAFDSERNPELKQRYGRLMGELEQDIAMLSEQSEILRVKIKGIETGIRQLESHLDYLGMVEESIKLGKKLGSSMRDLNRQLDDVLESLGAKVQS